MAEQLVDKVGFAVRMLEERGRQVRLWGDDFPNRDRNQWLAILGEEVGEVAEEDDPEKLVAELVQVAAVCSAWAENVHRQTNDGSYIWGSTLRGWAMRFGRRCRTRMEAGHLPPW